MILELYIKLERNLIYSLPNAPKMERNESTWTLRVLLVAVNAIKSPAAVEKDQSIASPV